MMNRCVDCCAEFRTEDAFALLCPRCQRREDREYANTTMLVADAEGRPYARRTMQERLSTTGDADE